LPSKQKWAIQPQWLMLCFLIYTISTRGWIPMSKIYKSMILTYPLSIE